MMLEKFYLLEDIIPAGKMVSIHFLLDMLIQVKPQYPPAFMKHLKKFVLTIKSENLKLINTTQYQKTSSKSYNYINLFFECSDFNGDPKIGEPEKCDDLIWLSIDQFNTIPIIDSVRFSLESALNNIPFSTFGFDQ